MFYTYGQNNSGGYFIGPAMYVVVEAGSAAEADSIAESKGLYFDGAGDCECCGNRWSAQWDDEEGKNVPEVYGEAVERSAGKAAKWRVEEIGVASVIVYYKDGHEERVK